MRLKTKRSISKLHVDRKHDGGVVADGAEEVKLEYFEDESK